MWESAGSTGTSGADWGPWEKAPSAPLPLHPHWRGCQQLMNETLEVLSG